MPTDWTEVIAAVAARTVHISVLPYDTTLEKLGKYFSERGQVNQVRLLKYPDVDGGGVFRGAALVEMSTEAEAAALLGVGLQYEGALLRVQSKSSYEALLEQVCNCAAVVLCFAPCSFTLITLHGIMQCSLQEKKVRKDGHTVDVLRPLLTVEGLPPDPEQVLLDEKKMEQCSAAGPSSSAAADVKTDSAYEQEPVVEDQAYVVKEDEKNLLVRFEVVGKTEGLGTGKCLRDTLGGQMKGVRFVEHAAVCSNTTFF